MSGEPTAVIKLTKSEVNKVIRSLVLSAKTAEMFDYNNDNGDKESFTRLKEDFIKIQSLMDSLDSFSIEFHIVDIEHVLSLEAESLLEKKIESLF